MESIKKREPFTIFVLILGLLFFQNCEKKAADLTKIESFQQQLSQLAIESDNQLITKHFESIQRVIDAERVINPDEAALLNRMHDVFLNDTLSNPTDIQSYLNRERTLILAWTSPSDGKTSFSWLRLPINWEAEKDYPLYVHLHGSWDVAAQPISYMSFTFNESPSTTYAFEDGYWLSPWARGNEWYHGISKSDVWEAIAELEKIVTIDDSRKYLSGHSMGGLGAWYIAKESNENWASIGIHSGALFYKNSKYVTPEDVNKLKNVPIYFVWGSDEESVFHESNTQAINLLSEAGNQNLEVMLFEGGHDYNEIDVENMYNWMRTFRNE